MRLQDVFKNIALAAFVALLIGFAVEEELRLPTARTVCSLSILTIPFFLLYDQLIRKPYEAAILQLMAKVEFDKLPDEPRQFQAVSHEFPWVYGLCDSSDIIRSDCEAFMRPGTRISSLQVRSMNIAVGKGAEAYGRPATIVYLQVSRV